MQITGYLDGFQMGRYSSANFATWAAGEYEVLIGPRHMTFLDPQGALDALIHEARIYKRALTGAELAALTRVDDPDSDGDGLNDGDEVRFGYDPTNPDTDGDGTPDGLDDSDGDGLTAAEEIAAGTSPIEADTDRDGLDDPDELNTHGTDPANPDSDGDLLEDGVEVTVTDTNPLLADTDGNGTSDGDEDPDKDRYTNLQEVDVLLTDPLDGTSRFAFEFAHSPTNHSLSFTALSGRGYRVERSVDVSDPTKWAEVISFVGSGSAVTVPLGPPFSQRWFYRVVVSLD